MSDSSIWSRLAGGSIPATEKRADIDLGDFFRILLPRWRLLPICLAATLGVAGAYVLFTPARYAASMSFMVDTRERPPVGSEAAPIPQSPDVALVENQMRLLQSTRVLKRVVEREHLRDDPEFTSPGFFGRLKSLFGRGVHTAPTDIQLAEALARAITVKRADKSYVIDLEVRASQPEKAERLAEALSQAFLDANAELLDSVADQETKWLDQKIDELRRRLEIAEARVQEFRAVNAIVVTDGLTPTEDQLKDANAALVAARNKRAEAEAQYQQFLAAGRGGGGETVRSPLMEKLRAEYAVLLRDAAQQQTTLGPRHPAYIALQSQLAAQRAQIDRELRRIQETQRRDVDAARGVEREAEAQVNRLKKAITDSGGRRIELNELERKAESLRDNYQKALAARESTRREIVSSPNPVLINQPVALQGRVSPKTVPAVLIALAGGVNLWIVAALLAEYLARRGVAAPPPAAKAREADPFEHGFTVPDFDAEGAKAGGRQRQSGATLAQAIDVMEAHGAPYRRAMQKLYEALREEADDDAALVVAIGARAPQAGATTLAISLALLACEQGESVLVVDANAESPSLASLLPHLAPVKRASAAEPSLFRCRSDAQSGGKIFLTADDGDRFSLSSEWIDQRFDLVLLDYGVSPLADDLGIDFGIELDEARDGRRRARISPLGERARFGRREPATPRQACA